MQRVQMNYSSNKWFQRDILVYGLVVLLFVGVAVKAVDVLIVQSDFLQSEGNKRQIRALTIPAPRGDIFDRNGVLLALSTPIDSIWVDPKILSFYLDKTQQESALLLDLNKAKLTDTQLKKRQADIERNIERYHEMLRALNLAPSTLTPKIISHHKRRFMYIKRGVLPSVSALVSALDVPGVFIQNQYKRYYPTGAVNAHVIGFTNIDGQGIAGLEKTYDDWLRGEEGKKEVIKDRAGRVIDFVRNIKPAKPGKDLNISIDNDIQYFLYHALKKAFVLHQAKSAQAVILDAKTGEILAMAALPGFNPNNRGQLKGVRLRNGVVANRIEPGSPTKPFVIAKALDLGVLKVDDIINTNPGSITVQGSRISDTRNHGELTPAGILKKSSNVGASKVAFKMSPNQQRQMMEDIGFGQDSGLYLPGEALGYVRPASEWHKIDQASASFGYGFDITLMQLARAYTIFTNKGVLLPISLLKNEVNDGDTEKVKNVKHVVSAEVAASVLQMLKGVTEKGGTAPKASLEGYQVAGKTGTVHKTKLGGYEENKYLSLFVGIVPVSNPRYIMAVSVNEPSRGVYYGGLVAAPIFKEVMEDVLRLKNIPPDKSIEDVMATK